MANGDGPRDRKPHTGPAGTNTPAATIFAGNIMALVAVALLFGNDEDGAESPEPDPDPSLPS